MRRRRATKNTDKDSGTQHTYAAATGQDPPPNNYDIPPVMVSMAAPAPVPDAEAQIFNPSHSYQPPILPSFPTTMPTSSSPYDTPIIQAAVPSPYVYTPAPSQDPVKAMAVNTSDTTLHPETFGSHSKDHSVDGNAGKPIDYPHSAMDVGSPVSLPGNPQAISAMDMGNPASPHGNPQAISPKGVGSPASPSSNPQAISTTGSPFSPPSNPQAIVTTPDSRHCNPHAVLEQQPQLPH
ncbi:hypothetical protein BGW41_004602 [Actinomortierella wolfii]|nr:hypothetical protein BGW41_004602 [Actinomortierella wolfii]